MKHSKIITIKSKTNYGEFAKQRFCLAGSKQDDDAMLVQKNVLTDRIAEYKIEGFEVLRVFKGKALVRQNFGLKVETLNEAIFQLSN